jgi:hypothetical protein
MISAAQRPAQAWPSWLCAATSPALFISFVTLLLHVRLGVGHWPKPMWEDYSTFALKAHELVALGLFATSTFVAPVIGVGLLCFRATRGSWQFHVAQLGLFAGGWILVLALWHADPFQFVTWLKD